MYSLYGGEPLRHVVPVSGMNAGDSGGSVQTSSPHVCVHPFASLGSIVHLQPRVASGRAHGGTSTFSHGDTTFEHVSQPLQPDHLHLVSHPAFDFEQ